MGPSWGPSLLSSSAGVTLYEWLLEGEMLTSLGSEMTACQSIRKWHSANSHATSLTEWAMTLTGSSLEENATSVVGVRGTPERDMLLLGA